MNYSGNSSNSQVFVYTQSMRVLDMVIISQLSKTDTKLVLQSKRSHESSELQPGNHLTQILLIPVRKLRLREDSNWLRVPWEAEPGCFHSNLESFLLGHTASSSDQCFLKYRTPKRPRGPFREKSLGIGDL